MPSQFFVSDFHSSDQSPLVCSDEDIFVPMPSAIVQYLNMFTLLDEARLHTPERYSDRSALKFVLSSGAMTNDVTSPIRWNKSESGKSSVLLFVSAVILE